MWIALHTFAITFAALTKLALASAGLVAGVIAFISASLWLTMGLVVAVASRVV